jgi:hypothetical protein
LVAGEAAKDLGVSKLQRRQQKRLEVLALRRSRVAPTYFLCAYHFPLICSLIKLPRNPNHLKRLQLLACQAKMWTSHRWTQLHRRKRNAISVHVSQEKYYMMYVAAVTANNHNFLFSRIVIFFSTAS